MTADELINALETLSTKHLTREVIVKDGDQFSLVTGVKEEGDSIVLTTNTSEKK